MLLRDHLKDVAQCALKAGAGVGGSWEACDTDPGLLRLQLANALEAIAQGDLVGQWELGRVIGALITAERQVKTTNACLRVSCSPRVGVGSNANNRRN